MREIRTSGSMRGRPVVLFGIAGRSTLLKLTALGAGRLSEEFSLCNTGESQCYGT